MPFKDRSKSPEYKRSGDFIAETRGEAGYTQEELARELGLKNRQTLEAWEAGASMPRGPTMAKLAAKLGISVDEILAGERLHLTAPALVIAKAWDMLPTRGAQMHIAEQLRAMLREPEGGPDDPLGRYLKPASPELARRRGEHEKLMERLQELSRQIPTAPRTE